jgi:hypothetical protein
VVSLIPSYWDTEKGAKEAAILQQTFPTLGLELDRENRLASIRGILPIIPSVGYTVMLKLLANYPTGIPTLWVDRNEIDWLADRHVNAITGEGCLCVRSEYRLHWPSGSDLATFIQQLVRPYFASQFFYDTHGFWPKDSARSHGRDGIIEAYKDLTAPLCDSSLPVIERVMRLLAGKRRPQGHEPCPCGSGLILRKCHSEALHRLRREIDPEHVAADFEMTFPAR